MSFSGEFKTRRGGNSYDLRTQPKMSMHADRNTEEVETGVIEGSKKSDIGLSPEVVDKRIKASLGPLHAQTSALTEMIDKITQSNSTAESTTASTRGLRLQQQSPCSEEPGSSKFPNIAPLNAAGYSPDTFLWLVDVKKT